MSITGRGAVPSAGDPRAVVLNVTATGAANAGYVTVWPCDSTDPPNTSNVNFAAGQDVANLAVVELSPAGEICLRTFGGPVDLIADVRGWFGAEAAFVSSPPKRIVDTRPTGITIDGRFSGTGSLAAGRRFEVEVTGRAAVPVEATSVVVNITATGHAGGGYLTAWPCTPATPPNASNLNFIVGHDVANLAVVPLSSNGTICIEAAVSSSNVIVDLNGWFTSM